MFINDREAWAVEVRHHAHGDILLVLLPLHARVERPAGLIQQRHGRDRIAVQDLCNTDKNLGRNEAESKFTQQKGPA